MLRKRSVGRVVVGLALLAAAGCGSSWNPESSRLDPGDLAFVVNPEAGGRSDTVPAYASSDQRQATSVALNARVQILEDQGPESEKQRLVLVVEKRDPAGSERTLNIPRRFIHRYHLARNDALPKPDPSRKGRSAEQSNWYPLTDSWK
jgi:hypothetical protein